MNCAVHTDTPATAYCRTCGKALCENCKRDVMGAIYCEPCIAVRLQGAQTAAPPPPLPPGTPVATVPGAPSPGIAMLLGFIPGVGAMYNGQFMKGFIHVVIFVLLIIGTGYHWAFGLMIGFFVVYMAFDAYKTAGVADINGWAAYLRRLGTGPRGPQRIYKIAQVRHKALTQGVATLTVIHEFGGHVDTPDDLQLIDSPSPLTTIEEKTAAKDSVYRLQPAAWR